MPKPSARDRHARAKFFLLINLFALALALPVYAQDFVPEQMVFPITDFKPDIKHIAPLALLGNTTSENHETFYMAHSQIGIPK